MADIDITITGALGAGKTTFAKHLFNLLVNGSYYIVDVEDSDVLGERYIQEPRAQLVPVRRAPRSVSISIVETTFRSAIEVLEDDEPQ